MDGLLVDLDALFERGPTCGRCGHPRQVHVRGPCCRDIPAAGLLYRCGCAAFVPIDQTREG